MPQLNMCVAVCTACEAELALVYVFGGHVRSHDVQSICTCMEAILQHFGCS